MPKARNRTIIFGGTGFIGRSLANQLVEAGYEPVLVGRHAPTDGCPHRFVEWDGRTVGPWQSELAGCAAVVNLAGRTVDCIKTPDNIDQILRSRLESTRAVGRALAATTDRPPVWVQMATGHIYGDPEVLCTEDSHFGYGLAPFVGKKWEAEFHRWLPDEMRGVILRTSFVLGRNGGALEALLRITRLGLGGTAGSGRQGMSWIHEYDMNALMIRGIEDADMSGAYLSTAPDPRNNREFMRVLRRAAGVPIGLPAPGLLIRLGATLFFRTDPELVLYGRFLRSERLEEEGFNFRFPTLEAALADLLP